MALSMSNLVSLFQLSFLLVTCFSHTLPPSSQPKKTPYYHKPMPPGHDAPCRPPSNPPTSPPVKPPTQPPVNPPALPPVNPPTDQPPVSPPVNKRIPGYVQGMVYCKSCKHLGVDTLNHAKPLAGARVSLKCKNKKRFAKQIVTTNDGGYFFMTVTRFLNYFGYKNCRVYLSTAPRKTGCREHTDLNNGTTGAMLYPQETFVALDYNLYTVGPFAFEPAKKFCKKHPRLHAYFV